jgi:hypothetical protein
LQSLRPVCRVAELESLGGVTRMSKIRRILFVATFLLAFAASAQDGPWAVSEHGWVVNTGVGSFGFQQWRTRVSQRRWTDVYVAGRSFRVKMPAVALLALVAIPLGAGAAFVLTRTREKREP